MADRTSVVKIMDNVTSTSNSEAHDPIGAKMLFFATGRTTSGGGTASIQIEGSGNGIAWESIGGALSLTLDTAGNAADSQQVDTPWPFVRARLASITGTGAGVDVFLAVEVPG